MIDQTGILDNHCIETLRYTITQLEQERGAQLRVLIVQSIGDQSIDEFANDSFHAWKLGRKGIDDGVLIVASDP